ncbi:MAG: DUF3426 domain-containing protein, partial [Gammaproteobacteria bacterium]|nr:DUF3426 domain-containing protein [Gammaproteobacteria bacterium]
SRPPSIDSLEGAESAVTSRRWLSMALALVLLAGVGAQSVHHFRDTLAIDPRTGPAVGWIYDTLGRPLYPAWPLEDYQIQAQDDALMAADRQLQIRATLTNRGARTLPPPLIRLTLLDRWGESLGSRMFQPGEYLPAQAPSRLLPGVQLDATLSVRAPPGELYGYRLDVCHRIDAGNVRCDAQTR